MPSIITSEERETPVLDLYNQGKNIREIAKGTIFWATNLNEIGRRGKK